MTDAYAAAGVDVAAGERAVSLMKASVLAASRPEVVGEFGGFAGLFDASKLAKYHRPLLATGTDGVGTKVVIAQRMNIHHTIGIDLVAMIADDIVVCGAEPLFLTDYIATGKVDPTVIADIVRGVAEGCKQAGMALIGGETAEHPGLMAAGEYDLAGAGTGVVEADQLLGADRVQEGDVLVGMAASGLHSNGYSLARHVLLGEAGQRAGLKLEREVAELGRSLGDELLEPTRIYSLDVLALADEFGADLHSVSHITGGGIAANIARVLPEHVTAEIERGSWPRLPIFDLIQQVGEVASHDMERTFNLGLGMVAIVSAQAADRVVHSLNQRGVAASVIGVVRKRTAGEVGDAAPKGGRGGAAKLCGDWEEN